ncbi:hypothetical protein KAFR_0B05490 [Kazachstania africana CBS 2517]|uniref:Large ribosomal subunit protein bL34m n=1 Tax=Kazachstania africana (strain ATCC 22294 / BCRC 22015 / CBS 2517 / CECT 1963 / NBRC 1671 / NRRL Y-8276) TaxID=1071382 RepID=H2AR44_KAZAF|nr:hypothetical protein KAFR_0B05490 [Kazachstania africana CBS 2517]CCF56844.1 hypothetical protein KAFR_0B05490 [Kazachstania africana CBS 2517]
MLPIIKTNRNTSIFKSVILNTVQSTNVFFILPFFGQKRWKSRGNTYQPSTLKRKRKFGFLSRAKSKQKSKILKDRKEKGRWYLSH